MLIDGALYRLPDGTQLRAHHMPGAWVRLDLADGRPYLGLFPSGLRQLIATDAAGGRVYAIPTTLTAADLLPCEAERMT